MNPYGPYAPPPQGPAPGGPGGYYPQPAPMPYPPMAGNPYAPRSNGVSPLVWLGLIGGLAFAFFVAGAFSWGVAKGYKAAHPTPAPTYGGYGYGYGSGYGSGGYGSGTGSAYDDPDYGSGTYGSGSGSGGYGSGSGGYGSGSRGYGSGSGGLGGLGTGTGSGALGHGSGTGTARGGLGSLAPKTVLDLKVLDGCSGTDLSQIDKKLNEGLDAGSPLYGEGNYEAAYSLYESSAETVERTLSKSCTGPVSALKASRAKALTKSDAGDKADELRDTFDSLLDVSDRKTMGY